MPSAAGGLLRGLLGYGAPQEKPRVRTNPDGSLAIEEMLDGAQIRADWHPLQTTRSADDPATLDDVRSALWAIPSSAGMGAVLSGSRAGAARSVRGPGSRPAPSRRGAVENNASGESGASMEAMSRLRGMSSRGEQFGVYDRSGNFRPLIGADAVDYVPRAGETFVVRGPSGARVLTANGGKVPAGTAAGEKGFPGFPKEGPTAPFAEQQFKFELPVQVRWPDGSTHVDSVKGLNAGHALARAKYNWAGADVTPLDSAASAAFRAQPSAYEITAGSASAADALLRSLGVVRK